jgi:hypothetical protein
MKAATKLLAVLSLLLIWSIQAKADERYGVKRTADLTIDVWVNKSDGATYSYGEDIAVYFRASDDCYAAVYDIDPAGNVSLLFPSDYNGSCFVRGGEVYRIPDPYDDYRLEVTGPAGKEYIYAVATYQHIDPPEFIRYEFFEYGNWDSYYDDFIHSMRGEREVFAADLNDRIANGPHVSAMTMFYIDDLYRHHRWYRHWHYDPYYIGSVWIGCDFIGAEVWIDGCYYGIAPIWIPQIYIGRHWIWIYYHGYPCWQDYVYVRSGQRHYVDAKINRRYHDFDYGRRGIRDWRFKEERYRNEPDFVREADKYKSKRSRTLAEPPSRVIEKYSKRASLDNNYSNKVTRQYQYEKNDRTRDSGIIRENKSRSAEKQKTDRDKTQNRLSVDPKKDILKQPEKEPESRPVIKKESRQEKSNDSQKSKRIEVKQDRGSSKPSLEDKSSKPQSRAGAKRGKK